jgi:hypothetical protein
MTLNDSIHSGKALVEAALLHEFDCCVGIEILEGLYTAGVEMMGIYNAKACHLYIIR